MNLANMITLARLVMVPVIVVLMVNDAMVAAFWLFLVAGASDAVDGILAKRFGMETVLGSYLDPIADKALLVSAYVALSVGDHIAVWLTVVVVFRDLVIVGGAILFHTLTGRLEMQPLAVSKLNTGMQSALVLVALSAAAYAKDWQQAVDALTYIVAFTTVVSGAAYLYVWGKRAGEIEEARKGDGAPDE